MLQLNQYMMVIIIILLSFVDVSPLPEKKMELDKHRGLNGRGVSPSQVRRFEQKVASVPGGSHEGEQLNVSGHFMERVLCVACHQSGEAAQPTQIVVLVSA